MAAKLLEQGMHFSEFSSGKINPTELIALLINQGQTFVEGIEHMYKEIKGSCSLLLLTEDGIIAARDSWGRTPVVVGKKEGAYAVTGESTAFPNLDYETVYYLGPGEIVRLQAEGMECLRRPHKRMQVCSFLWVYYGFPTSCYEGKNVEEFRFACGKKMGERDRAEVDCACGIPDSGIGMAFGVCGRKGSALSACHLQVHSYMAPELHAEQSGDAFLGGQDETDSQPRHAERQARAFLR